MFKSTLKIIETNSETIKYLITIEDLDETTDKQIVVIYETGKNIIHIPPIKTGREVLYSLGACLVSNFKSDSIINVKFELSEDNDYDPYLNVGFGYPYIKNQHLNLSKHVNKFGYVDGSDKKLLFALEVENTLIGGSTSFSLEISPSSTLRTVLENLVWSCGKREVCGGLTIQNRQLSLDSLVQGGKGCIVRNKRYSFHIHPQSFYEKYKVNYGYPSGSDFYEFLSESLKFGLVLHIVCAVEGYYVISLTENWCSNMKILNDLFLNGGVKLKTYTVSNFLEISSETTPQIFCDTVNETPLFKGEYPVFNVEFLDWLDTRNFLVYFPMMSDGTCITDQETLDFFARVEGITRPPWGL